MALRIREEVDLKELEKFGFINNKYYPLSYTKKVYLKNENDDKNFYHINKKTKIIKLTRLDLDGELDNTLYDLIQAGLVEKVEE